MPDLSNVDCGTDALGAAIFALLLSGYLAIVWRRVRGSTLQAPAAWAVAAVLGIAVVEFGIVFGLGTREGTMAAKTARYAAAAATLCPLIAVLGAKRPQNRGWQWVVLSLWVVLLVPAGQAWASHAASTELAPMWRLLLVGLVGLGLLNYLPTRYATAAALLACGQWLLVFGVPRTPGSREPHDSLEGVVAFGAAAIAGELLSRVRLARTAQTPLDVATQRWLAFRNGWGAFWGLRVRNRINEAAELAGWPVRLEWGGFGWVAGSKDNAVEDDGVAFAELDPRVAGHIEQTMDSVLRRFERVGA